MSVKSWLFPLLDKNETLIRSVEGAVYDATSSSLAEYLKSPTETMVLRDEDHSIVVEAGWKRLNTLKHYWVQDGAVLRIKSRREFAPPGRGMY